MYLVFIPVAHLTYFDQTYKLIKLVGDNPEEAVVTVSVEGFHIAGVMSFVESAPSTMFPETEIHSVIPWGELAAVTILMRSLYGDNGPAVDSLSELQTHMSDRILGQLVSHLQLIGQLSGKNIELIISNRRIVAPSGTKQNLRVVLGSPPPGYSTTHEVETLFEIPISDKGYTIAIPTPSVDVGIIVKSSLGESVAQIVENTIYLLLSVHPSSFEPLSDDGGGIFKKTLMLAWNMYSEQRMETSDTSLHIESAQGFAACTLNIKVEQEIIAAEIKYADDEIEKAQGYLRRTMTKKRTLLTRLKTFHEQMSQVDYEQGWAKLTSSPYFDFATKTSDERIHYFTKPLTIKDAGGTDRFLGRFGIRLQGDDRVTVWSLDYPHYSGIPHPHINKFGDVCLGNVTESLWQLLLDYKEAEAAVLVMRLLAEGYEASLTEHPIEQWPTIETYQKRKRYEPLPSTPHVELKPHPSSNASGSWINRQLHRFSTGQSRST